MKIVYMGTPRFSLPTLKALFHSAHQILGVVTQPDRPKGRGRGVQISPIKNFALESRLKILQPEKTGDMGFIEELQFLSPDLIVVAAFGQILKPNIVDQYFCLNLHASVLPKYRGAAPINRAFINGDSETGITTIKMDKGLDTGGILLIKKVKILETDDSQILHETLAQIGASLVLETIDKLEKNSITPIPQDSSKATYAPKLIKEDGRLLWNKKACDIRNRIRGLVPWPGAFTFLKSKRIQITKAETTLGDPTDKPGTIVRVSDHGIEVGTGDGRLVITELQPEGKKIMPIKSFLQGYPILKGDRFNHWQPTETTKATW